MKIDYNLVILIAMIRTSSQIKKTEIRSIAENT